MQEKRLEEFALAESKDQGKPVKLAKNMDIPRWASTQMIQPTASGSPEAC